MTYQQQHIYEAINDYIINYNCLSYLNIHDILRQFSEMEDYDSCIVIRDQLRLMERNQPFLKNIQHSNLISVEKMLFDLIEFIEQNDTDKTFNTLIVKRTPQLKIIHTTIEQHFYELTREWSHCERRWIFTAEKLSDCPCDVDLLHAIPTLFDHIETLIPKENELH